MLADPIDEEMQIFGNLLGKRDREGAHQGEGSAPSVICPLLLRMLSRAAAPSRGRGGSTRVTRGSSGGYGVSPH